MNIYLIGNLFSERSLNTHEIKKLPEGHYVHVSEKQKFDRDNYSIFVDSFLNHDYTEKDE